MRGGRRQERKVVALGGAGAMGRGVVRKLAEHTCARELVIADVNAEHAARLGLHAHEMVAR